jgi:cell wall-associated NlpC family hydrolase
MSKNVSNRSFYALFIVTSLFFISCEGFRTSTRSNTKSGETATSALRRDIVDYAKSLIGSPYKYAGSSPKTGFDCSGFTSYVLKEYKVKVSPASSVQATEGRAIALDKVLPGDLIFFGEKGRISHVAMLVKREKDKSLVCVHSTTSRGVIMENVTKSNYWKPKILFARTVIR